MKTVQMTLALIWICLSTFAIRSFAERPPTSPYCQRRGFRHAPVILINIDGMHPTFLARPSAKILQRLATKGVFSEYMRPVYPTKTFPNLYTMVTGLYPESHGIVDNHFKDPATGTEFYHKKPETHDRIKWGGEPIWVTAKKNGIESAVRHWPGSQQVINGVGPGKYSKPGRTSYTNNIKQALTLIGLPEAQRPGFITIYFNEPDSTIHKYGPKDPQVDKAIAQVTKNIELFFNTLFKANLTECVNVIVVSDHGGTSASCDGLVYLNQIANLGHVSFLAGPSVMIQKFKSQYSPNELFEKMRCPKHDEQTFDVYKKADMPRRHHYSNSDRIGDLVVKMKEPYNMFRYNTRPPPCDQYKGGHGYDDGLKSMQGIFIAYGAHFQKQRRILPFQSIELYNLMAALLGVEPAPNNGTYGLLADALNIPHEPRLPAVQPIQYYGFRSGISGKPGLPAYGGTPVDEGYESDSNEIPPYGYNKKKKREEANDVRILVKRQQDVDATSIGGDDYYGTNLDSNAVIPEEDNKAEKERHEKLTMNQPSIIQLLGKYDLDLFKYVMLSMKMLVKTTKNELKNMLSPDDQLLELATVYNHGFGQRFLNLFRRKPHPPPGPAPDPNLKILYGPSDKDDDLTLIDNELPKIVTQPTKIIGDHRCCQPSYSGARPSTNPPSETTSVLRQTMPFGPLKSSLTTVSILPEQDYSIGYDEQNGYPLFVSYAPGTGQFPKQTSIGCINMDNRLKSNELMSACLLQEKLVDQTGAKLIPLKLFNGAGDKSNVLSNVVYVYEDFYNNIWAETLGIMNGVAKKRGAIVVLGPIFDHNGDSHRDDMSTVPSYIQGKRVLIPSHFFIATLYCGKNQGTNCPLAKDVIINSFIIPHTKQPENCEKANQYFRKHYARIKDIELLTGLNFFLKYPPKDRVKLTTHFYLNLDEK